MRFRSADYFQVDPRKLVLGGLVVGGLVGGVCLLLTGRAFGEGSPVFALVCGSLVFYVVVTIPKRLFDGERVSQARDAPFLSAVVNTTLSVTGSVSRTYLAIRSDNPSIEESLGRVRKGVILGRKTSKVVSDVARDLASYSASNALVGAATLTQGVLADSGEESQGLSKAEELSEETRYPLFLTVCFFSPLMLVLFAILSQAYDLVALSEIVGAELLVLDVTFYLCYGGRERL